MAAAFFLTTTQTRGRHIWPLTLRTRSISRGGSGPPGALPAGERQGVEGFLPTADEQRLSLVYCVYSHPLLGRAGVPQPNRGAGHGEPVERHIQGCAYHRGRTKRSSLAGAFGKPFPAQGKAQRPAPEVPALHQLPWHRPDRGAASGSHLGGRGRLHLRRPALCGQYAHGGAVHRAPCAPGPTARWWPPCPWSTMATSSMVSA